ncbi:MAG: hypothetical protein OEZ36_09520 [Spirochaetota bacterium]|nr:hypothetical protein [Spirochaetota bacterium]
MTIPQIDTGKKPSEPLDVRLIFWLPADSPYGNFQLKLLRMIYRLDEANRRIVESFRYWHKSTTSAILLNNEPELHILANEQAIYLMRKTADELVSLIWILSYFEINGKYPSKVKCDHIGAVVKQGSENCLEVFVPHLNIMKLLNEISNAFKHSFINSDYYAINSEEPYVTAFSLDRNRLKSQATIYNVSFIYLIIEFSYFYKSCIDWLKAYSVNHRN